MLKLRYIGDQILRRETKQIEEFDDTLKNLVESMIDAMKREEGIGLAAPQIGHSKKVLVVDVSGIEDEESEGPLVFINPEIIARGGEATVEEGCLSIPDIREDVSRPEIIGVKYQNEKGDNFQKQFSGWMARVLQHEIDHINGILFIDLISPIKRQVLAGKGLIPETY